MWSIGLVLQTQVLCAHLQSAPVDAGAEPGSSEAKAGAADDQKQVRPVVSLSSTPAC